MSQSPHEQSNPKKTPTPDPKKDRPPVDSASPDDPIEVKVDPGKTIQ